MLTFLEQNLLFFSIKKYGHTGRRGFRGDFMELLKIILKFPGQEWRITVPIKFYARWRYRLEKNEMHASMSTKRDCFSSRRLFRFASIFL